MSAERRTWMNQAAACRLSILAHAAGQAGATACCLVPAAMHASGAAQPLVSPCTNSRGRCCPAPPTYTPATMMGMPAYECTCECNVGRATAGNLSVGLDMQWLHSIHWQGQPLPEIPVLTDILSLLKFLWRHTICLSGNHCDKPSTPPIDVQQAIAAPLNLLFTPNTGRRGPYL